MLEAYNVLSDSQKRANYDQFGDAAQQFGGFSGFKGAGGFSHAEFDFEDLFSDFGFGDLFGQSFGRRQNNRPRAGQDIGVNLSVSFEQAAFGTEKELEIRRRETCDRCKGDGTAKKDGKKTCSGCNGSGIKKSVTRTFLGTLQTQTTCNECGGIGTVITDPCPKCDGKKIISVSKKISIKIPAGINSGNNLRLEGQGHAGEHGARAGNVFVVIFVEPHQIFKRHKNDIFMEMPISFSQAALGAEMTVPTLKKSVKLKVPASTQTDTVFKLKGQGVKDISSHKIGDEYIKVIVKTPAHMSKRQKELFEELFKTEEK